MEEQSKSFVPRGRMLRGKFESVNKWADKLNSIVKNKLLSFKTFQEVKQVEAFRRYIKENPMVKMYLQGGLDQIPEIVRDQVQNENGTITKLSPRRGVNYGITYDTLLDQFAQVTRTPPSFADLDIIGVPFYALIVDLLNTEFGRIFFAMEDVNKYLKPIFNKYEQLLESGISLLHMNSESDGWLSPKALQRVNYNDFICNPKAPYYGFRSWNDWFTREIKESARPFNTKADNEILNNSEHYPNFNMPHRNVKWHDKFWLKDQHYSLAEMFGADSMSAKDQEYFRQHFEGGTVYQGFLNPWCYHRWRAPVSGCVERCYKIGTSYYGGNPSLSTHLESSYVQSQPLLSMTAVRQIYVINANNPKIGRLCVMEIGMVEVSGIVQNIKVGQQVEKGSLLGMFRFGGSSHVIIFSNKAKNLEFSAGIHERDSKGQSVKQLVRSVLATVK